MNDVLVLPPPILLSSDPTSGCASNQRPRERNGRRRNPHSDPGRNRYYLIEAMPYMQMWPRVTCFDLSKRSWCKKKSRPYWRPALKQNHMKTLFKKMRKGFAPLACGLMLKMDRNKKKKLAWGFFIYLFISPSSSSASTTLLLSVIYFEKKNNPPSWKTVKKSGSRQNVHTPDDGSRDDLIFFPFKI